METAAGVLSVMMPVFNEERTLETILGHVLARPEVGQLIAVDDGSSDGSWAILQDAARRDPRIELIRHEVNRGKGIALQNAISRLDRHFAVVQDADLEYDPADYPKLLTPLLQGRTDVVYGVRGFAAHTSYSYWFVLGNKAVTLATNLLFDCYISDMETGYKMLRSELWGRLHLRGSRFDIEPDITGRILRMGYRIHEVPIRYYARSREEGKKLTWKDGARALFALTRLRLATDAHLFGPNDDRGYHLARQVELRQTHPLHMAAAGRVRNGEQSLDE